SLLRQLIEHEVERMLRAHERRGESDVEAKALHLQPAPSRLRFLDAFLGQTDIAPAGKQVFQIPLALAMAHEDENTLTHWFLPCAVPVILRWPRSGPRRIRPKPFEGHPSRLPEFTIGRPLRAGPVGSHLRVTGQISLSPSTSAIE